MALQIIRHAFRMVFGNLGQALRVSVGPYLILMVILFLVIGLIGDRGGIVERSTPVGIEEDIRPTAVLMLLALVPVTLFIVSWVAVAWHRFILLEEFAGLLPRMDGQRILAYMGRTVLYAFVLVIAALPLLFLVTVLATPLLMSGEGIAGMLLFIGVTGIMTYLWLRIGLALPSVALGNPITMVDAWRASKGMAGTIFGVAFLLMGLNGLVTLVTIQVSAVLPLVGFVLDIGLQWTVLMLGVSILTTFYGHLIEGRPLTD